MKIITLQGFFVLLIYITSSITIAGQQKIPVHADEKVILFSDRTLYITGEQILFSAYIQSGDETNFEELSRVLYCELITPEGNKITGNKYLIINCCVSGTLTIPDYIITGNYYLKAYTKFMRNEGPNNYHFTLLKIVNPNRSEFQSVIDNGYLSESLSNELITEKTGNSFLLSTNKTHFARRDTVHILVENLDTKQSSLKGLCLTVVPEFSNSSNIVKLTGREQSGEEVFYYPEPRGVSITGKLTDNVTGNPLVKIRINLSIIGAGSDFMSMKTDSAGRFFFSLPNYTGSRDLFLCAENTSTVNPKISIDNDFCTLPVHLPTNIFVLTKEERETAFNMAINLQLESYFKLDSITETQNDKYTNSAFYGNPDEILYIDNYVQLPTLEEYFNELPTLVKVKKQSGKKYFKVLGLQTQLSDFEPLVMVDLVAIDDPSKILAISPANISRIEVDNVLYVKGDQIYGGIINFISRKDDFAGIDLPSSGIFINYSFLTESNQYPRIYRPQPHFPDTRNTLYWEPQLALNKNNATKVSFTTSDTPGKYLVILNGINLQGETFRQVAAFEVLKENTIQLSR